MAYYDNAEVCRIHEAVLGVVPSAKKHLKDCFSDYVKLSVIEVAEMAKENSLYDYACDAIHSLIYISIQDIPYVWQVTSDYENSESINSPPLWAWQSKQKIEKWLAGDPLLEQLIINFGSLCVFRDKDDDEIYEFEIRLKKYANCRVYLLNNTK